MNKRKDDDLKRGISEAWNLKAMFVDNTLKKIVEAGEEKEKSDFGKKCANKVENGGSEAMLTCHTLIEN